MMASRRSALQQVFAAAVTSVLFFGGTARAQTSTSGTQQIAFDRPEAWALKYFTSATMLAGLQPPVDTRAGELRVGLEAGIIPHLSAQERTVGFNGSKEENLNKLPVLLRPQLTFGLPWDLSLLLAYIPPIKINGARPNLFAASLARVLLSQGPARLGIRLHGQIGSVTGDFTCPAEAVAAGSDPVRNPFGCTEPSSDVSQLRYLGFEVGGAYRVEQWLGGIEPHLAIAINAMALGFDVHARYAGIVDTSRLETSGVTFSSSLGVAIPLGRAWRFDVAAYYSPLLVHRLGEPTRADGLLNARALVEYRVF